MNKKVTGKASSMPVGIGLGVSLSMLVTVVGSVTAAWLIASEKIAEDMIGCCAMAVLVLSSFLGSWIAALKTKRLRLQVSLITGGVYYLLLLSVTALFFGGQYQGMGVTAVMVVFGCIATALIGLKGRKRKKAGIRKKAFC